MRDDGNGSREKGNWPLEPGLLERPARPMPPVERHEEMVTDPDHHGFRDGGTPGWESFLDEVAQSVRDGEVGEAAAAQMRSRRPGRQLLRPEEARHRSFTPAQRLLALDLCFSAGGPLGPSIGGPPGWSPTGGWAASQYRWSPDGLVTAS